MTEKTPVGVIVKTKDGALLHPDVQALKVHHDSGILELVFDIGSIFYRSYDSVYYSTTKIETLTQPEPTKPGEFDDIVETRDVPHGLVPEGFIVHTIYQKNLIVKRKTGSQPIKEPDHEQERSEVVE